MENASNALLIAGGILLTLLIVSVLLFMFSNVKDYNSYEEDLKEIVSIAEFNSEFNNYAKDEIRGYELVSLANKIADYNLRYGNSSGSINNDKYGAMSLIINIPTNKALEFLFNKEYNGKPLKPNQKLFKNSNGKYIQSDVKNEIVKLFSDATKFEDLYGGQSNAIQLAKSINSLILTQDQLENNKNNKKMEYWQSKQSALETFFKITKIEKNWNYLDEEDPVKRIKNIEDKYEEMVENLMNENKFKDDKGLSLFQYYEYYQFKKASFECTDVQYYGDSPSDTQKDGRIKSMTFKITEKSE